MFLTFIPLVAGLGKTEMLFKEIVSFSALFPLLEYVASHPFDVVAQSDRNSKNRLPVLEVMFPGELPPV